MSQEPSWPASHFDDLFIETPLAEVKVRLAMLISAPLVFRGERGFMPVPVRCGDRLELPWLAQ